MKYEELTLDQIKEAMKAGTPEEMKAYLEQADVEIPAKAPWGLPEEIEKFGMKLWQTMMIKPIEKCADDEHDWKPSGNVEMERTKATGTGSSFRREFVCTKCPAVKWVSDMVVEEAPEEAAAAAAAPADDRAARRAARKAAREAAAAKSEE